MNTRGLIALLVTFVALGISPASPLVPSARAMNCGMSKTDTWFPAPGVGVFLFLQACGFNPSPGFTSEFHNVTTWTNSTKVQAVSSDFYFEDLTYPCTVPSNCKTLFFKDMDTGAGVFPRVSKTLNKSNADCVNTTVQFFKVTYTPTRANFTFRDQVMDIAAPGDCVV